MGLQAVTRHIKGHLNTEEADEGCDRKPAKIKRIYTVRDVVKQNYRALVEAEIPFKSTDKQFIGSYQRAVTTVIRNLSDEDLEEAKKIAEIWSQQGAPPEAQLK
jgi:hypothetical protein